MTNPVGTKEQRAAYLEGRFYVGQKKAWVQCGVVKSSFDGLDIAEEIVRAEQVVEWLAGREAYVLLDRDLKWWRYWRIAADKARWGALSKWAEWKCS